MRCVRIKRIACLIMNMFGECHCKEFNAAPECTATAPGRFHLIGDHSWFFKDKTVSMAVNIPVYVSVSRRSDTAVHFYFVQLDERKRINLNTLRFRREDRWANAIKAIIYGFIECGFTLGGMNISISSEVLPSAGFGITTAIKTAAAIAFRALYNLDCTDKQLLKAIEIGNKRFLQQGNRIADYYAALYAKRGRLIVTDHTKNTYELVPFSFSDKTVLMVDAAVPRITTWDEETLFEPANALILGDLRESKHDVFGGWRYISDVTDINEALGIVSEDTRRKLLCIMREHFDVLECISAMQKDDFFRFARAVNRSHESLRDYYDHSCPEIEWLLKRVAEIEPRLEVIHNPVSCGRMTGKGFGRCIYAVLRSADVEKFKGKLREYEHIFGFKTACYEVTASDGARILED